MPEPDSTFIKFHRPLASASVSPIEPPFSSTLILLLASDVPLKATLILSPLFVTCASSTCGLGGGALFTLIVTGLDRALLSPAGSIWNAAKLCGPSPSDPSVRDQRPARSADALPAVFAPPST